MSFRSIASRFTVVALLALLTACGGLPRPFEGYSGSTALRLAQPPTARLVVMRPTDALLPDAAADGFPATMAASLSAQDVPAVAGEPKKDDWQLVMTASVDGDHVVPMFKVIDASGEQAGLQQGQSVPTALWASAEPPPPPVQPAPYLTAPPAPAPAPTGAPTPSSLLVNVADTAAPGIASLLTNIQAARRASDPNSLVNRQARIMVPDVTGAPGDGNRQLARQMRLQLGNLGLLVQDTKADFTVTGQVNAVPIAGKMTRIEIQWIVKNDQGDERGRIVQLNEIPAGSLDKFWGDVAMVVAQEAAGGVKDVVARQTGAKTK